MGRIITDTVVRFDEESMSALQEVELIGPDGRISEKRNPGIHSVYFLT